VIKNTPQATCNTFTHSLTHTHAFHSLSHTHSLYHPHTHTHTPIPLALGVLVFLEVLDLPVINTNNLNKKIISTNQRQETSRYTTQDPECAGVRVLRVSVLGPGATPGSCKTQEHKPELRFCGSPLGRLLVSCQQGGATCLTRVQRNAPTQQNVEELPVEGQRTHRPL